MNSKKKRPTSLHNIIAFALVISLMAACLSGCGSADTGAGNEMTGVTVYYLTASADGLTATPTGIDQAGFDSPLSCMNALISAMRENPDISKYSAPLSEESGFKSAYIQDNQIIMDFDERLTSMDVLTRTLIMASAARTLTQLNGIETVNIMVNGTPILDSNGMVIGALSADSFIDNAGLQINAEERTQLTLYFTNETGDKLIKVNRMVVYSGNIPMDKLVVQQLLAGPRDGEKCFPVLNPDTKLINVTTQDGTCYVNLDKSFLSPVYTISNDVAIYSIVDSLIELGTVNRVQFLIDSDSDVMFREAVSLNTQFDRNLDIVEE